MRFPHRSRTLWLAAGLLATGCATGGFDPDAKVTIVTTDPAPGSTIEPDTRLRIVAEYSLPEAEPGRDQITVAFKTYGGKAWEPAHFALPKPKGRVTVEVSGAEVLSGPALVHPLQMLLWLDRGDSADKMRTLRASEVVRFEAKRRPEEEKLLSAKLLPPNVGTGQLISDVRHDPRYMPHVPLDLSGKGLVYWGLYKICVDTDGSVFSVSILKSAGKSVDPAWMRLMGTWRYRPYTINGVPFPFCHPMRLEVQIN